MVIIVVPLVSNIGTLFRGVYLEQFMFKFIFTITLSRISPGRVAFIVFYIVSFAISCLVCFSTELGLGRTVIRHPVA